MSSMQVKVRRLHAEARLPVYASKGAACFDLHSLVHAIVWPGDSIGISTGLAFEIPQGFVMLLFSRSGHAFKNGVRLANCVGVIDSDYRGEVLVALQSDATKDSHALRVSPGDRIAQAMIIPVPSIELVEATELSETERGAGGFGSTGA